MYPITLTSVVARLVALAVNQELITKLVPLTIVPTLRIPRAAAPVDPTLVLVRKTIELVVIELDEIVAVPPTKVTVPKLLAPAAVVVPTEVLKILFPEVPRTKLPLLAVIAPKVAVRVVEAVNEPVIAVFPVVFPMVVTAVPVVFTLIVPVTVIVPADLIPIAPPLVDPILVI